MWDTVMWQASVFRNGKHVRETMGLDAWVSEIATYGTTVGPKLWSHGRSLVLKIRCVHDGCQELGIFQENPENPLRFRSVRFGAAELWPSQNAMNTRYFLHLHPSEDGLKVGVPKGPQAVFTGIVMGNPHPRLREAQPFWQVGSSCLMGGRSELTWAYYSESQYTKWIMDTVLIKCSTNTNIMFRHWQYIEIIINDNKWW